MKCFASVLTRIAIFPLGILFVIDVQLIRMLSRACVYRRRCRECQERCKVPFPSLDLTVFQDEKVKAYHRVCAVYSHL
ncbi:hypothetical protein ACFOGG_10250 [Brenneria rubrifaciens]|uniref:hypothetical protein n=1 Tax=Brenneria rubrifaciens TaxID=55213 RepID=UPI00361F8F6C